MGGAGKLRENHSVHERACSQESGDPNPPELPPAPVGTAGKEAGEGSRGWAVPAAASAGALGRAHSVLGGDGESLSAAGEGWAGSVQLGISGLSCVWDLGRSDYQVTQKGGSPSWEAVGHAVALESAVQV